MVGFRARSNNPVIDKANPNSTYYSLEIGLIHFVVLQGYCPVMPTYKMNPNPCLMQGSPQYAWLRADLSAVDRLRTPWVVVVLHQPFVNSNSRHSIATEGVQVQAAIEDVLNEHHVDLMVAGHVHAYERSCALYQYKCNASGPVYVTIGNGGVDLDEKWVEPQPSWSLFRLAVYGHGNITAYNATHLLWAWRDNARTFADAAWITRGA